ncbi:MAG TPA: LCP family protein [Gaiellaceae bacterium]|nr:LCP family protein [Gaiellaceae bacterium]
MRTTLKRGMGRGAAVNGNGRSIFPPGPRMPMTRYRQPEPPRRGPWGILKLVFLWTILAALIVVCAAAGGIYLKTHEFIEAVAPKTKVDKAAAKELDIPLPGQATTALLIGTDKRRGPEADLTGRSDTLMLVRADPQTNSISLLSFPRDMVVNVYCHNQIIAHDRINSAFADCGSLGSLETVRNLTGVPINYFITVNFHGFLQLVDRLGGVWMDVDHRYLNTDTGPGGYSAINLWPGYQKLRGLQALSYVRYRHFDSDLYRVVRQQLFLKALKAQITSQMSLSTLLDVVDAVEKNVIVGRGGNKPLDPQTLRSYIAFARSLPAGHIFQASIQGLTGYSLLTTDPSNITAAVNDFLHPDVQAAEKASAATLGIRHRTRAPQAENTTVSVLNGNGIQGSAANASYLLRQRGYKIVLPPAGRPINAPNFNYFNTTIYYSKSQRGSLAAAKQMANLFGDADVKLLTRPIAALANGAMVTAVVGQNFHGTLAPAPVDHTPPPQPPAVVSSPGATLSYLRSVRRRVDFRLEVPHVIEHNSEPEPLSPIRVYPIVKGYKAVRLSFEASPTVYWGIEETNWNDAPILGSPSFEHRFKGRLFDFYFSGPHLHMVVLKQNGATYWVINSISDELSNETMLAIARGLRPLGR